MKFVRWFLGRIILLLDFVFRPRSIKRSQAEQAKVDELTRDLALYQFKACPFCVKVRRSLKRNAMDVEIRDAKNDPTFRQELQQEGGRLKVPCLKITDGEQTTWMYESSEIVNYLEQNLLKSIPA